MHADLAATALTLHANAQQLVLNLLIPGVRATWQAAVGAALWA